MAVIDNRPTSGGGGGGGGAVNTVNGMDGDVILGKADIGLNNVDNTPDMSKPVSTATQALFNQIGVKNVRTTRFEIISSGTSGTISTKPPSSTIILDDFGGTIDAVISKTSGGKPTYKSVTNSSGGILTTTFDATGNWVLSGTPSTYPIAIVYRVAQTLQNFDSTATNIVGIDTLAGESTRKGFAAKTSNQTIAATTFAHITFSNEIEDTENAFDGTAYTIPESGMWEISGLLVFTTVNAGNFYIIAFSVNGNTGTPWILTRGTSGSTSIAGGSGVFRDYFTAGTKIRMMGYCQNATVLRPETNYQAFSAYKL